jgi:cation-transporting ATPase 13A3/4/5
MIVLILDNNGHFTPKLFDGMNVLIGVFMFCWFISCTWFSFLVIYKEKLNNFFRIRESLDRCEYVHMLKDEPIQIIHMDTSGVSTLIERIERLFVFNFSKNSLLEKEGGYEKTVQVKTLRDGTRYLEFQHVRYLFHKAHGRFVPGYLMDLDLHLDLHQRNPSNNLLQLPVPPVERCMMSTSTMMSTSSLRSMISNSNNGGEREREEEEEQEEQEVEEKQTDGLSVDEYAQRLDRVGYNTMEIELPSVLQSIMNEIFSFFYVYQLMCYYVWYFTGYWYVAFLHCIMIIVAATISLISKRQMLGAVVEMTKIQTSVAVKREGVWMTVRSANIVPGDLVRVAENWIVPSDMIIIKGSTVCDESMLTGESMPVQKFPFSSGHLPTTTTTTTTTTTAAAAGAVAAVAAVVVPPSSSPVLPPPAATVVPPPSSAATAVLPAATATAAEVGPPPPPSAAVLPAAAVATTTTTTMTTTTTTNQSNEKKYTLFAGTKTLTSGRNEEILAIVQSTGAQTRRGQLIQSILYPAPMRFKFDEHLKAVMVFLFTWGIFAAYLAMHFLMGNAGLGNKLFAFVYGMFMLSGVLSPLIPVVLTIGHFNASKRLQKLGIFSLNTHAIKLCGKIRVFCFDKTGTITKEGLDYRGCIPVTLDGSSFLHEFDDMTNRLLNPMMKFALASCHAVGSMEGELVGSEVEVKMFHSTQWKLVEKEGQMPIFCSPSGKDQLQIIKRFEFDHHRMCMSVVVRHLTTGSLYVFCKGSYENLLSVSIAASVPLNYTCTAEKLAKEGCYVLGIAFKELPNTMTEEELVTLLGDRYAIETKLSLLGLIMFRNELKPESREAIMKLKSGDVRTVMITGDNAMTACYIARECGMIGVASPVILGDILPDKERPGKNILLWKDIDTDEEFSAREMRDMVALRRPENSFELAVTGKAFEYLVKMGDIELLLLHIRIFSRMTPGGKVECVKQHMAAGAVTGMCGDGGNDCGALRIAHVGVALSDAEASVVSPFTSKTKSVMSTVDLCREGRCTLATSFGGLKFLIMYGFVGCGMRFVMYSNGVFIPEWGFVFQDGLVLVGLSYCITLACPLDELGPQRPTSSLVGPTTLCSIFGQTIIHILFLYNGIHFLTHQSWYCPFNPVDVNLVKWWGLQDSNLGTTLFLMIAPQEMIGAIAYSLGSRFRKSVYRNSALMIYFTFLLVILSYLTLGEPNRFTDQFRIASSTNVIGLPDIPLPMDFRWKLFIIILGNMTTIVLFEWLFILGPVRDYFRTKFHEDILRLRL